MCTAKVSEAEAMFANGVEKILMTTCNVSPSKPAAAGSVSAAQVCRVGVRGGWR